MFKEGDFVRPSKLWSSSLGQYDPVKRNLVGEVRHIYSDGTVLVTYPNGDGTVWAATNLERAHSWLAKEWIE